MPDLLFRSLGLCYTHFLPTKKTLKKPDVKTLKPDNFRFWWHRRFDARRIRGEPRKISFNGFNGWALSIEASFKGVVTHDIVEVNVSNGCAAFNLRIEAPPATDNKPLANVKSLISAIRITKTDLDDHPQGQRYRVWLKNWLKKRKQRATARSRAKSVDQSNK